jgi:hypothetical protein
MKLRKTSWNFTVLVPRVTFSLKFTNKYVHSASNFNCSPRERIVHWYRYGLLSEKPGQPRSPTTLWFFQFYEMPGHTFVWAITSAYHNNNSHISFGIKLHLQLIKSLNNKSFNHTYLASGIPLRKSICLVLNQFQRLQMRLFSEYVLSNACSLNNHLQGCIIGDRQNLILESLTVYPWPTTFNGCLNSLFLYFHIWNKFIMWICSKCTNIIRLCSQLMYACFKWYS